MRKKAGWVLAVVLVFVVAGGVWAGGRLLWDAVRRLHGH